MKLTPALEVALKQCTAVLRRLDTEWAIGGAVAMAAHGYTRATRDVDLFVGDDAREELLEALRERSAPVLEVNEPYHYALLANPDDAEERVDLLFPSDQPEVGAIWRPVDAVIAGEKMPVMRCEHLVASKLLTEPASERYAKDHADLLALRDRNLVDGPRVLEVLKECAGNAGGRRRLVELLRGPESSRSRSRTTRSGATTSTVGSSQTRTRSRSAAVPPLERAGHGELTSRNPRATSKAAGKPAERKKPRTRPRSR